MNGNFNGVLLRNVTVITTEKVGAGFMRTSFRVLGKSEPKLEQILQLNAPALLILGDQEIEGKIFRYLADVHSGYEITIEGKPGH